MNKEQQELSEGAACLHGWYRPECNSCNPNANNFDPAKVRRVQLHVDAAYWVRDEDYDALLALHNASLSRERELQAKLAVGDGSCDHCGAIPSIIMPTSLCDKCADGVKRAEAAESQLLAKDALIASLKEEISKQNKAEDELLATGEKLAEERNEVSRCGDFGFGVSWISFRAKGKAAENV